MSAVRILILAVAAILPPSAPAAVRILPLGDSITQGVSTQNSYRRPLWHMLIAAGYAVDFVGSSSTQYPSGSPPNPDFDLNHEGHSGFRAEVLLGGLPGWLSLYEPPDVVLLHIGTNDAIQNDGGAEFVARTRSEIEQLIRVLQARNPNVTILLAKLIPLEDRVAPVDPFWNSRVTALNGEIDAIARAMTTAASRVVVVDHYAGFNLSADTYDGIHPNAGGENKMARKWFDALVEILPSPVSITTLRVESSEPAGTVFISAGPNDRNGRAGEPAPFSRIYDKGSVVSLTAPESSGGKLFRRWQRDGIDYSADPAMTVTMDGDHTLRAIYVAAPPQQTWSLAVESVEPASGVLVVVSPGDRNGHGSQTTPFVRVYQAGEVVSLIAPLTAGGNFFQKWQRNGVDYTDEPAAFVTINGNHILRAVYGPATTRVWSLTVESAAPSGGVPVGIRPTDRGGLGDGTTLFTRAYEHGTEVSLTAPLRAGGHLFQKWQRDGLDYSTDPTAVLTMDGAHTMRAVYAQPDGRRFVNAATPGPIRNDFTGWIGMRITVGPNPVVVTALGRMMADRAADARTVKLVDASDGTDLPGGSTVVEMNGAAVGQFRYGALPSSVTLQPGRSYYVVSREFEGAGAWYGAETLLTAEPVAICDGPVLQQLGSDIWSFSGDRPHHAYGPVDFQYFVLEPPPARTLTASLQGDEVRLTIHGHPGERYRVELTDDLFYWVSIGTVALRGTSEEIRVSRQSGARTRFFRAVPF